MRDFIIPSKTSYNFYSSRYSSKLRWKSSFLSFNIFKLIITMETSDHLTRLLQTQPTSPDFNSLLQAALHEFNMIELTKLVSHCCDNPQDGMTSQDYEHMMLLHLCDCDCINARFVWMRTPQEKRNTEVATAHQICQDLKEFKF